MKTFYSKLHSNQLPALLILLATVIGEAVYVQKIFINPDAFILAAFDIDPRLHFRIFQFAEALSFLFLVTAFFENLFIPSILLNLFLRTFINLIDLAGRTQFVWLPVALCLAIFIDLCLKKTERNKDESGLSVALLLSSIYFFGSFHKLINFELAREYITSQVFERSDFLKLFCNDWKSCWPATIISWAAAFINLILALLTLSTRLVRYRILLAFIYHFLIAAVMPFLTISYPILLTHVFLLIKENPVVAATIIHNRKWKFWGLIVSTLLFAVFLLGFAQQTVLSKLCFVALIMSSIAFLLTPFFQSPVRTQSRSKSLKKTLQGGIAQNKILLFYVYLLILFGFSPLLMKIPYSELSVGWSMFSANTHHKYILELEDNFCHRVYWNSRYTNLRFAVNEKGRLIYYASNPDYFLRLERFLKEKKKCLPTETKFNWTIGVDPLHR